jgi:DNA-binding transcriptional ArsR family regulator
MNPRKNILKIMKNYTKYGVMKLDLHNIRKHTPYSESKLRYHLDKLIDTKKLSVSYEGKRKYYSLYTELRNCYTCSLNCGFVDDRSKECPNWIKK